MQQTKSVDHCIATGVPSAKTNVANITEYYKTTSNVRLNEGFFARLLVLVEGETEELSIPEYLKSAGIDCDGLGISIILVQGKNQIPKYWRLYSKFKIPTVVLFDNDNAAEKTNSNIQLATCFDISVDNILSDVVLAKEIESPRGCKVIVIESDFEFSIRTEVTTAVYNAFETEARELIKPINNQQKGVISRYIARKLIENDPEYVPKSVALLKEIIIQTLNLESPG
jgi:putative ATP-dependent endonuclease of OLD family